MLGSAGFYTSHHTVCCGFECVVCFTYLRSLKFPLLGVVQLCLSLSDVASF